MKQSITSTVIQNTCVMVVCIWALTPQLAYSDVARLVSVAAVGLWLLIELWRPNGIVRFPPRPVLLMFVYSIYTLLFELLTHGASGVISSLQLYIMLFFLLAQQARRNSMDSLIATFWLVIVLNALWMTTTYLFLSTGDARAMRVIVRSSDKAQELTEQGVGGYGMAYGAVLLLPVLTMLSLRPSVIDYLRPPKILRLSRSMPRLLIWYLTAISLLLIVKSQFSIAVLAMTVSVSTTLVLWRLNNVRLVIAVCMSAILIFFGKDLLIWTLTGLQQYAEGTNYRIKIDDLLYSLQVGSVDGTARDRVERYMRSISLFLDSPLWGVLYYTDVGKHSTLLDGFARWGAAFGSALLFLVVFPQVRALKALSGTPGGAGVALGSLVAVLIVFGLNKHFMSAGIILYIVYPLVFLALKQADEWRPSEARGAVHA